MDLNIEPLLNMTFDEHGIEDFFTIYDNKISHELNLLKTASLIQSQIKNNENLLNLKDYGEITEEIAILSKILQLNEIRDIFFTISEKNGLKNEGFSKENRFKNEGFSEENRLKNEGFSEKNGLNFEKTIEINTRFCEYICVINEEILDFYLEIDISLFSPENKPIFLAIQKEMIEKIYLIVNSIFEEKIVIPNTVILDFITKNSNFPLIKSFNFL